MNPIVRKLATAALEAEARSQGIRFIDPRDVILAADDVCVDASDGTVSGCAGALERLVKDRPHLLADGKRGRQSTPSSNQADGDGDKPSAMTVSDQEYEKMCQASKVWKNVQRH